MSEVEEIQREIVQTQEFVRERLNPITKELALMREEQERLAGEVRVRWSVIAPRGATPS